jgi:hypothetical protein
MSKLIHGIPEDRAQLLRNPTLEGAMKLWNYDLLGPPAEPETALAGLHKARLKWKGSTKQMVKESKKWLSDRGYGPVPHFDPTAPMAQPIRKN